MDKVSDVITRKSADVLEDRAREAVRAAAEMRARLQLVNDDLERAAREVIETVDRLRRRTIDNDHTHVKEPKHA